MEDLHRGISYERNGHWQIELCDEYEHIDENIEYAVENLLQTTNTQNIIVSNIVRAIQFVYRIEMRMRGCGKITASMLPK